MFEKLIEAIKAENTAEAQKLIAQMDTNELSKVNNDGDTTLSLAVLYRLEKVCELLIPRMSEQAINHIDNQWQHSFKYS
ncbi:putative ankyrin repeat protein [Rickettsia hoogstraalii str. RCCE3]|uniref:ankyrin repeat domain-containing protein n=1 Tax=Rickettsia hoogstraalii TaxID=467174 RepID=UPI00061F17AC|nr:ankyrin repeat domain-containing protein [Rickettsia hoogstraalii]KJV81272.1 putative ankyrin repeat protein [Rickettsia hoogstraalii str. RCCE3]